MTHDAPVTHDLLETLRDGQDGFAKAAEKLLGTDRPDLATSFRQWSDQRRRFADELRSLAADRGDTVDESGTLAGAVHRGWMSVKDALAGSDPEGILDAAEQGEDHAVDKYRKALTQDLSPTLRTAVERQAVEVEAAHDQVRALRDARQRA